jgi:hypothetical protein
MLGIDFATIANAKACCEEHFVANGGIRKRTPHISIRGARLRLRSVQCRRAGRAIVRRVDSRLAPESRTAVQTEVTKRTQDVDDNLVPNGLVEGLQGFLLVTTHALARRLL